MSCTTNTHLHFITEESPIANWFRVYKLKIFLSYGIIGNSRRRNMFRVDVKLARYPIRLGPIRAGAAQVCYHASSMLGELFCYRP